MKLPDDILTRIQESVQVRRSPLDSNFNFIHQEDVFIIAQLAFQRGKECAAEELGTIDKQTTNNARDEILLCYPNISCEWNNRKGECRSLNQCNRQRKTSPVA